MIWFALGLSLMVAEILTGTFYLLAISAGFFLAGITELIGFGFSMQMAVAGIASTGCCLGLHSYRKGKAKEPVLSFDVGQKVNVTEEEGVLKAQYRGSAWSVEHAESKELSVGEYTIVQMKSNTIVVS